MDDDNNTIRQAKKRAFVAAIARRGTIRAAAQAAGIDRTTYYVWAEDDDQFVAAVQVAKQQYGDLLEEALSKLALKEHNVTALIVALKMAGRFVDNGGGQNQDAPQRAILLDRPYDDRGAESQSQNPNLRTARRGASAV